MRGVPFLLALILALPALAADRIAAPAAASLPRLRAAHDDCRQANPQGDRCFNLQIALARMLIDSGDATAATDIAEAARRDAQRVWSDADDVYIAAEGRASRPGATAADKAAHQQAMAAWKALWLDQAVAAELLGTAYAARSWHRHAAQSFRQAASIRAEYGSGDANRDRRLHAAAQAAVGIAGSDGLAAGEAALRPVLAEAERVHGANSPFAARIRLDLADMLAAQTREDEAQATYLSARTVLRGDAAAMRDADARYVRFLTRADRGREAEPLARDLLARLFAAKAGPGPISTAYLDLAALLPLADAQPLVEQAVELRLTAYGEKHMDTARARIALARLLERSGRMADAAAMRAPALLTLHATQFSVGREKAAANLEQGENLVLQGKAREAVFYLTTALRAFEAEGGEAHPGAGRTRLFLAMSAAATGSEDPRPLVARAMAAIRAAHAPTHIERLQAEFIYALMLRNIHRDLPAALAQNRRVVAASLERLRSFPDFGPAAQYEMKQVAPVFMTQIALAWEASQTAR